MPIEGMMLKKKPLELTIDAIVDNGVKCSFCSSWNLVWLRFIGFHVCTAQDW